MPFLAIPFPNLDPVIVSFGPFAIRWYALAYIAGLVLGWRYIVHLLRQDAIWPRLGAKATTKKTRGDADRPAKILDIDDLLVWVTLGVIVGGRLGYVLFYQPGSLLHDPLSLFAVWRGGMSFHGGFLGVVVAGSWFCHRRGLSALRVGDTFAAAVPIGLFFGRIANFINSELWGNVTTMPWGFVFPNGGPLPRHPSQLYEAGLEGLLMFIVLRIATHKFHSLHRPGLTIGLFVTGYGLARIFVEFFRRPDEHIGYLAGFVTMGMVLSLPMVLIGLGFIWRTFDTAPAWLRPNRPLQEQKK